MDCDAFQAELPDLLYGELEEDARPGVEAHLRDCASCRGLTEELRAVKGSLPTAEMPPLLHARIGLHTRDALLEARGPAPLRGGPLHLVAAIVLGLALVMVGFGLGRMTDGKGDEVGRLVLPDDPEKLAREPLPGEPPERPGLANPLVPRAPEAWQRVLHDAARDHLRKGDASEAREFFRRAEAVHPQGPLAVACRLGAAEAAIMQGHRQDARQLLRSIRASLTTGEVPNGAALLERVQALEQELGD